MKGAWGNIRPGERVSSAGRHGAGQPKIEGVLESVQPDGTATVRLDDGTTRRRSASNLRVVTHDGPPALYRAFGVKR